MRVLLLTQNYAPETGATPNRIGSFVEALHRNGHEAVVITAKPNHPEGVIWPAYRGGLFREERVAGARVIYTWVYTSPEKRFVRRMLFYLTFMVLAVVASLRVRGRVDAVLATSPPLFVGVSGWLVSRLRRCRFVFDVRDLWPDLAVAMEELRHPRAIRMAKALEHFIYARADGITAVTESFCKAIARAAGAAHPAAPEVVMIANGTLPVFLAARGTGREPLAALGLEKRFVVTFAGNMGLCQGLAHVLEAAARLQARLPGAVFLFVGEGIEKERLQAGARARRLENVVFLDRVPLEAAARLMAASDALLVPLARHDIYRMFIPSKLFDSMAAGRPVLLSVDGEARRVVEDAGAGVYYPAEDGAALAERVVWLHDHPEEAARMGARGTAHAEAHLLRETQAQALVAFLERVTEESASPGASPPPAARRRAQDAPRPRRAAARKRATTAASDP